MKCDIISHEKLSMLGGRTACGGVKFWWRVGEGRSLILNAQSTVTDISGQVCWGNCHYKKYDVAMDLPHVCCQNVKVMMMSFRWCSHYDMMATSR